MVSPNTKQGVKTKRKPTLVLRALLSSKSIFAATPQYEATTTKYKNIASLSKEKGNQSMNVA